MQNFPNWKGQPYYPISQFYRERFGEKVYKISVSTAESCPVRKKEAVCIFCDEWGSAGSLLIQSDSLQTKIRLSRERIAKRYKADRFLVYFQPYTSTFERLSTLERQIEISLAEEKVVGIVLGTRPDCLPKKIFPLLRRFHEQAYVSVELGVQSFSNRQLTFLKRGHTVEKSLEAIQKLHELSGVDVGIHLMMGLPDESPQEIVEMAETINQLPINNVKLHNLHVLSNTPLEELYRAGKFSPVELEEYAEKVILFLEHLSPHIPVQRLAAVASRWEELVAPEWTKQRMRPVQYMLKQMADRKSYQGLHYQK
ncbi:MAG: TIGR01212 family radical SAM protein [SAR324 cluster bacterium]|uniref:TIGR01212 family radical SAM protein n=1 Tax=SAR324 cluster bacterium TaxID=2024889 RepID=A0A2A4T2L2_9DELT|nr:MAG: TIGR01212 family radical SAM protein [SAR324 cluster bacterium]